MMNIKPNRCPRSWLLPGATLIMLIFLSSIASPALAQSQSSAASSDEWKFTFAPYILLPWMNGTSAVRGVEADVDVGPGEIFDSLQFSAMGYFEARKAKWGFGVDAIYMALGTSVDIPPANVDINQGAYSFFGLRQLNKNADLLFGARLNVLQGKFGFKGPLQSTLEDTKYWVDPFVGLKLKQRLSGPWSFTLEGDIGGFGAGSDFAWQLFPWVGVDVSKRVTLGIGYRALSNDFETGSGDELFKYDVVTQAFVLGASINF